MSANKPVRKDRQSVLLVDDNNAHQYSLGKHLTESGFEVFHAHTGAETLEFASAYKPDVVLLDINLPDIDGFEICARLKANDDTKAIPIVFHSATHDTQTAKARAADLGAASFLSYPISIEHLITVIKGTFIQAKKKHES